MPERKQRSHTQWWHVYGREKNENNNRHVKDNTRSDTIYKNTLAGWLAYTMPLTTKNATSRDTKMKWRKKNRIWILCVWVTCGHLCVARNFRTSVQADDDMCLTPQNNRTQSNIKILATREKGATFVWATQWNGIKFPLNWPIFDSE